MEKVIEIFDLKIFKVVGTRMWSWGVFRPQQVLRIMIPKPMHETLHSLLRRVNLFSWGYIIPCKLFFHIQATYLIFSLEGKLTSKK